MPKGFPSSGRPTLLDRLDQLETDIQAARRVLTLLLVPERTEKGLGVLRKALGRATATIPPPPVPDPPVRIPKGRGRIQALVLRELMAGSGPRETREIAEVLKLKVNSVGRALVRMPGARHVRDPKTHERGWVFVSN